jgi:microcystin-dependent protein
MSQSYIGEIRIFGGNFAPLDWALCDGAIQAIDQNQALFQLIGTTYGGDGQTTFALPDLRGRVPIHQGSNGGASYVPGERGGAETVTLTGNQMPVHTHALPATSDAATQASPAGAVPAAWSGDQYSNSPVTGAMAPAVGTAGGSQAHENMLPVLALTYIISLFGVFPSQ